MLIFISIALVWSYDQWTLYYIGTNVNFFLWEKGKMDQINQMDQNEEWNVLVGVVISGQTAYFMQTAFLPRPTVLPVDIMVTSQKTQIKSGCPCVLLYRGQSFRI